MGYRLTAQHSGLDVFVFFSYIIESIIRIFWVVSIRKKGKRERCLILAVCCIRIFFYQNATSVAYCCLLAASTSHPLRILSDEKKLLASLFFLGSPFWSRFSFSIFFPIFYRRIATAAGWKTHSKNCSNWRLWSWPIDVNSVTILLDQNDSINQVRAAAHLS